MYLVFFFRKGTRSLLTGASGKQKDVALGDNMLPYMDAALRMGCYLHFLLPPFSKGG